ncbi:MAG: GTPase Era [Holosporales bacterium]|jgi:GTP-binding protein Era|nr:GTPase Era [Holosporales bacterium]
MNKKCSFVAIVGEPNVGKSTLVNLLVGEKISIVSNKIQTTRRQIRGITTIENTQIVFIDTPGFCKTRTPLERAIVSNFRHSYKDADLLLIIIDATSRNYSSSINFIEKIKNHQNQIKAVVINKVDIAKKENIIKLAKILSAYNDIREIFMISALKNDGIDALRKFLEDTAPLSNWFYEEDQTTDITITLRLAEITREKLFERLTKELPYNLYVETEIFKNAEKKARIYQSIVVMKDSQKGIIIGKNADMLKNIKTKAIEDMKALLKKKIELHLFVKVKEKWVDKKVHLQNAGIVD